MSTVRINPQTGIPEVMPDTRFDPKIGMPISQPFDLYSRGPIGLSKQPTQQPMPDTRSPGIQQDPNNTLEIQQQRQPMQQPMNIMNTPMRRSDRNPMENPQRRLRDLLESGVFGGGKITPRTGIRGDGRSANDLQRMLNRQTVAKDEVAGVKADIQSLERDRAINRMARQMANNQPQRPTAPVQAPPERDLPRPPNPFLDRIRQADVQPQLGMGIGAASPDGMEPRGQLPFSGGLGPNINNMGSPNGIMGGFNPMQQPQQFAGGYGQQPQQTPYQQYGLSGGGYQQNPYQAAQPQPQQYGGYGPNQSYGGYGGSQGVPNPYAPQQVGQMASQIAQPMY